MWSCVSCVCVWVCVCVRVFWFAQTLASKRLQTLHGRGANMQTLAVVAMRARCAVDFSFPLGVTAEDAHASLVVIPCHK